MIIEVVSENPDLRTILKIIKILENDGLIVIPTDTIYAFAVSIKSKKAIKRLGPSVEYQFAWSKSAVGK